MKILDLLKLSRKNITSHKKQSILTIIVIGSLFSLIMAITLIYQGLENNFLAVAGQKTDGEILVAVNPCYEITEEGQCSDSSEIRQEVTDGAKSYNGEVIDIITTRSTPIGDVMVLPMQLAQNFIEVDNFETPDGAIPILASINAIYDLLHPQTSSGVALSKTNFTSEEIEEMRGQALGKTIPSQDGDLEYYIAGILPVMSSDVTFSQSADDFNILNVPVAQIVDGTNFYLVPIDDGSEEITAMVEDSEVMLYSAMVNFTSLDDAYAFYKANSTEDNQSVVIYEPFSNLIEIHNSFEVTKNITRVIAIALVVIALIIMIFTFIRLIDQDAKIIALYRSLGASSLDIITIYFFYLLKLCILAIVFAVSVALILALIVSYNSQTTISSVLTSFYAINVRSSLLIGLNGDFWLIIASILLSAPICIVLTFDQFSAKHIAKKLKN